MLELPFEGNEKDILTQRSLEYNNAHMPDMFGGGAFGGGGNSYQPLTLAQYMQMTGGLNSTQTNPPE